MIRVITASMRRLAAAMLAVCPLCATGQEVQPQPEIPADSIAATSDSLPKKKNIIERIKAYFDDSNKPKKDPKAFDIGVIGGPYYSNEIKLALGIVATGSYCLGEPDSLIPRSFVAIKGKISTSGFVEVGLEGTNIFPHDRFRINYLLDYYYRPTDYWGIGYERAVDDDYKSKFNEIHFASRIDGLVRIGRHIFVGPGLLFSRVKATNITDEAVWADQPQRVTSFGIGVSGMFDTRDNLTAPTRGVTVEFEQQFFPRFMGNTSHSFSSTALTARAYQKVWKGGIIAERIHGRFAYGNVPWNMLSTLGGSNNLRGYYEGQYRDKCEMDLTVELRQHVWRRNSIVVWGGVGAIAPDLGSFRLSQALPNVGIGYRWEFKRHSNVRIDIGFGKHCKGFVFGINEAF